MSTLPILFGIAVKATIILLVGSALSFALRRPSSASRMLLWNLVFACLLILPLLTSFMPAWSPPGPRIEAGSRPRGTQARMPVLHFAVTAQPVVAPVPWGRIVITIWLFGAAIVLGRLLIGMLRVRAIATGASPVTEPRSLAIRDELERRFGLSRSPVLLETSQALPPMTWGVTRPVILLPESGREWPHALLRMVLAHELIHVRRLDYFSQIAAHVTCALYWFHPLAWFAAGQLSKERELSCDDEVLNMGTKGTDYAEHLVRIVRTLASPANVWPTVTGMLPSFEGRVAALLDVKRNRRTPRAWTATLGVLAALCILLPLAGLRAPAQDSGAKVTGVVHDPSGAVVPRAMVTLSAAKRSVQAASTDVVGRYEFSHVPEGSYTLEVGCPGFAVSRQDVRVGPDGANGMDVVLNLGGIRETVEVVGKAPYSTPVPSATVPQRIRVGGNVQASRLISKVQPYYPLQAEQAGIQGTVLLHAVIGKDGHLLSLGVANTGVNSDLANAAMDAVRQWAYEPTLLNGEPVEVVTTITVVFRLKP